MNRFTIVLTCVGIRNGRIRIDDICQKFLNKCPLFSRHASVGDPTKKLLKLIKGGHIDLVVMAGRGSESHFDFGSVTDRVIKSSTVSPVLIPA